MTRTDEERITYKESISGREVLSYLKAAGVPAALFMLAMLVLSQFGLFGRNLLAPMVGAMWLFGVFVAFMIQSQRTSILTETHVAVAGYLAGMFGFRALIGLVAGTSSEQLMATYSQALPLSSGNTVSGFLQTMLWITSVMVPIGFMGMQGKKLIMFRKRLDKQRFFDQIRGIRNNGKEHNDYQQH
jgi:hypothetical protein